MAVTSVTTAMAGAINYTVVTDTSADWPSVANSTYFYDKADKLVHYKDSAGTVQEIFSGSGLTVGTTAVTSGTDTRVFFQAGGVVQQDAKFTYNNTQKRLTLTANSNSATDISFNVVDGNGYSNIQTLGNGRTDFYVGQYAKFSFREPGNGAPYFTGVTTGNTTYELASTYDITNSYTGSLLLYPFGGAQTTMIKAVGTSYLSHSSSQLVIGSATAGARLDVRAQGALSTDIAFRVRNSADTLNTMQISGDGYLAMGGSPITMGLAPTHTFRGLTSTNNRGLFCVTNSSNTIRLGVGTSGIGLGVAPIDDIALTSDFAVTDAFAFKISGVTKFSHTKYYSNYDLFSFNRTISFASSSTDATVNITATTNKAHLKLDVASAPSGTHLDNGVMWHESNNFGFRVNGATIKIYQETTGVGASTLVSNAGTNITDTDTFDGYTLKQIVKALRNQGLLA